MPAGARADTAEVVWDVLLDRSCQRSCIWQPVGGSRTGSALLSQWRLRWDPLWAQSVEVKTPQ